MVDSAMRPLWPLAAVALLGSCQYVSFGRRVTDDELRLRAEVKAYYGDVARAFAVGNAQALAALFWPSITKPMTQGQILQWADKFFAEHKSARFRIRKLEFDTIGFTEANVSLAYSVETPGGAGGFDGYEHDKLVRHKGRWYIAQWEKGQERK